MDSEQSGVYDPVDEFIVYDSGSSAESESGKENKNIGILGDDNSAKDQKAKRLPKASRSQYNKIDIFMKEYDELLIGKDQFNEAFENLATELNDLGPPTFSYSVWRQKWTQYKYNQKRKRSMDSRDPLTTNVCGNSRDQDHTSHSFEEAVNFLPAKSRRLDNLNDNKKTSNPASSSVFEDNVHFQLEILDKLDIVIKNQQSLTSAQNLAVESRVKFQSEMLNKCDQIIEKLGEIGRK